MTARSEERAACAALVRAGIREWYEGGVTGALTRVAEQIEARTDERASPLEGLGMSVNSTLLRGPPRRRASIYMNFAPGPEYGRFVIVFGALEDAIGPAWCPKQDYRLVGWVETLP